MEKKKTISSVVAFIVVFIVVSQTTMHFTSSYAVSTPTMTVEGQFDRVELYDAHYGNWNGLWVVDEQLAIAYENGTVDIAQTHYEGSYTNDKTFSFLLLVYNGIHRLNETIYVPSGANSTYEYVGSTVTISLAKHLVIMHMEPILYVGFAIGFGAIIGYLIWMLVPKD